MPLRTPTIGGMSVKLRVLLALFVLASSHTVHAQGDDRARSAARSLAEDGVTALQNGDTNQAVDKLERAYQIVKLPTVGLWAARALVKAGRLVNAEERYVEVTRFAGAPDPKQDQAKADAAKEREALLPRIPSVTISIEGAAPNEVAVTLDGEPVLAALIGTAQPVDPKHHVVKATRGSDSVDREFDVAEGQKVPVTLKFGAPGAAPTATVLPPAAAPPPTTPPPAPSDATADRGSGWSTQRTIGLVVGGAGVVSAVVSGIFTASALSKKSDSQAYCNGGACTSQTGVSLLDDARSAGNVATITGIAGIALVGAGVVLFVTAPSGASGGKVAFGTRAEPSGASLVARGSF